MRAALLLGIFMSIQLSGGSDVILVSFLPDHCIGCSSSRLLHDRWNRSRDRKDTVRGLPGFIPRFPCIWTTSCLRPVNVRVALVWTRNVFTRSATRITLTAGKDHTIPSRCRLAAREINPAAAPYSSSQHVTPKVKGQEP